MHSAPTLACPAGSPMPSCGPSHSCGAGRNRYIASSPAYSQSRVNVTMDRAIATPLFPVITLQPLCFHAIAYSFPQRRSIRRAFDNLRALSIVSRGWYSLAGTRATLFYSAFVFILLRIVLPATPSLSQPSSWPGGGPDSRHSDLHGLQRPIPPIRNVDAARTSNYHCCKVQVPGPWMKPQN
jgi:hypothetical protein